MLLVPYLAGLLASGWSWPHLPLLAAWLSAYLLSYYLLQAVKTHRWKRLRVQLGLYAGVAVPCVILLVLARPTVLMFAPAYGLLFAVNAGYSWRRRERALVNDFASVIQSCLMVLVVATVHRTALSTAQPAFVLCLLYFLGTVLYVKTMIRERHSVAFRRWSAGYHLLALVVVGWLAPNSAALFAWLLVRSIVLPGRALTPKQVGLIEIANCAILLALLPLTTP
jgi:hypothetical protein